MLEAKDAAAQSKINKEKIFKSETIYLLNKCERHIEEDIKMGRSDCKIDCCYITDGEVIKYVMDELKKLGYKTKFLSTSNRDFPNHIQIEW